MRDDKERVCQPLLCTDWSRISKFMAREPTALTVKKWRTVRELAPTGSYRALQSSRMREHSRPDSRDGNKGTEKRPES
jgi:hypothetical protein